MTTVETSAARIQVRKDWGRDLEHHEPLPKLTGTRRRVSGLRPGAHVMVGGRHLVVQNTVKEFGSKGRITLWATNPHAEKGAPMEKGHTFKHDATVLALDAKSRKALEGRTGFEVNESHDKSANLAKAKWEAMAKEERDKAAIHSWSTQFRHHSKQGMTPFEDELRKSQVRELPSEHFDVGRAHAQHILTALRDEAKPSRGQLHRGVMMSPAAVSKLAEGKRLNLDSASWSKKQSVANDFASGGGTKKSASRTEPVVFHADKGTKGLDIANMSDFKEEQEVISGGHFKVTGVEKRGRTTHVTVHQTSYGVRDEDAGSDEVNEAMRASHAAWQDHMHGKRSDEIVLRADWGRDLKTLYHGTAATNAEEISRHGLKPSMRTSRLDPRAKPESHVYLTDDPDRAARWARGGPKDKVAVFKVRVPVEKLSGAGSGEYAHEGPIPPSQIERMRSVLIVETRDWQEWDEAHKVLSGVAKGHAWGEAGAAEWHDQDHDVMEKAHEAAAHLPAGKVHKGVEAMSDEEYKAHRDHVEHELVAHGTSDLMRSPVSTHNSQDRVGGIEGAYTPERKALHDQILAEYEEKAKNVPSEHRAVIMGGLGGAGKSTVLRHEAKSPFSVASKLGIKYRTYDKKGEGVGDPSNFITINPDDIKERMAELGAIPKVDELSPMEGSPFAHEEASMLAARIADRAQSQGKNVIHDITLNSVGSGEKRISALRQAGVASPHGLSGYHISGVMVDVSTAQSKASAEARHRGGQDRFDKGIGQGGRYVPSDLILGAKDPQGIWRSKNRAAFETLKSEGRFDHTITIDNEGYANKLVSETGHAKSAVILPSQSQIDRANAHNAAKAAGHLKGTAESLPEIQAFADHQAEMASDVTRSERAATDITDNILSYRRGEMPFQQLVTTLANRTYAQPSAMNIPGQTMADTESRDWSEQGTWGEVQHANDVGLLNNDEYGAIHSAAMEAHGQRSEGDLQFRSWATWDEEHRPFGKGHYTKIGDHEAAEAWARGAHEVYQEHAFSKATTGKSISDKEHRKEARRAASKSFTVSGGTKRERQLRQAFHEGAPMPTTTWPTPSTPRCRASPPWLEPSGSFRASSTPGAGTSGTSSTRTTAVGTTSSVVTPTPSSATASTDRPTSRSRPLSSSQPSRRHGTRPQRSRRLSTHAGRSWRARRASATCTQRVSGRSGTGRAATAASCSTHRAACCSGEPLNHFDGINWTFSKGHPDSKDEHPTQAAIRETEEETGLSPRIIGHVPGGFSGSGTGSRNHFYLMEDSGAPFNGSMMNGETQSLAWATPAQADIMIQKGTNEQGVYRDRQVLRAAVAAHEKLTGIHNIQLAPLGPPPEKPKPVFVTSVSKKGTTKAAIKQAKLKPLSPKSTAENDGYQEALQEAVKAGLTASQARKQADKAKAAMVGSQGIAQNYHAGRAMAFMDHADMLDAQGGDRADPDHDPSSTMVSLDLPPGTIEPVVGGLPASEHHITIVYAGKTDVGQFAKVIAAAKDVAAKHHPLQGTVGGLDSFPPSEGQRRDDAVLRHPGHPRHREAA